jgi:hypothetical protein
MDPAVLDMEGTVLVAVALHDDFVRLKRILLAMLVLLLWTGEKIEQEHGFICRGLMSKKI